MIDLTRVLLEPTKIYIKADNKATICCPECKCIKFVNVARFKDRKRIAKVKCVCKKEFEVALIFVYEEKKNEIFGHITNLLEAHDQHKITPRRSAPC